MDSVRTGDREVPYVCHGRLAMGAVDGTGTNAESQGFTMVTSETRNRRRHMIASSGSIRLSEQPQDPESNGRTVQESSLVYAESGPALRIARADGRHGARLSSTDPAEGLGHQQLNHAGHTCHVVTRVAHALGRSDGVAAKGVATKFGA